MKDQYYCRTCNGLRNHKIIAEKKLKGSEDDSYFQSIDNYYIIECLGCETLSFLHVYGDTEMVEYNSEGEPHYVYDTNIYPTVIEHGNKIQHTHYLPITIGHIYNETISAFKAKAYILTAAGFRAVIEATCNDLKIKKGSLSKRIDLLYEKGFLTLNESKRLHSIRFLGNDALHEMEEPKKGQLLILLEIVNHLLENLFIQDKKIGTKIHTLVDKYEEFIDLLRGKIVKENLDKEMSLSDIFGKAMRLIKEGEIKNFEEKLKDAVANNEIDFLVIVEKKDRAIYKVIKMPESIFRF